MTKKIPNNSARDEEIRRSVRIEFRKRDLAKTESELKESMVNVSILKKKIQRLKRELKELQK